MAKVVENFPAVTHNELMTYLFNAASSSRSIFIHGLTGIGKSTLIREFGKAIGCNMEKNFFDERPANSDSTHFTGYTFPDNETKTTKTYLPEWLQYCMEPRNEPVIIVLEELADTKDRTVLSLLYEMLQERTLRNRAIPSNVILIATGNLVGEDAMAGGMPSTVNNRLDHIKLENSVESFIDMARERNFFPGVIAYISYGGLSTLHNYSSGQTAFPTNRTWERTSDTLYNPMFRKTLTDVFKIEYIPNDVQIPDYFTKSEVFKRLESTAESERFIRSVVASSIGNEEAGKFIDFLRRSAKVTPLIDAVVKKENDINTVVSRVERANIQDVLTAAEYIISKMIDMRKKGEDTKYLMEKSAVLVGLISEVAASENGGSRSGAEFQQTVFIGFQRASKHEFLNVILSAMNNSNMDPRILSIFKQLKSNEAKLKAIGTLDEE